MSAPLSSRATVTSGISAFGALPVGGGSPAAAPPTSDPAPMELDEPPVNPRTTATPAPASASEPAAATAVTTHRAGEASAAIPQGNDRPLAVGPSANAHVLPPSSPTDVVAGVGVAAATAAASAHPWPSALRDVPSAPPSAAVGSASVIPARVGPSSEGAAAAAAAAAPAFSRAAEEQQPLPRCRHVDLRDIVLENKYTLFVIPRYTSAFRLSLRDYPLLAYHSSSLSDGLELVAPQKDRAYRLRISEAAMGAFRRVLNELQQIAADKHRRFQFHLIDRSDAPEVEHRQQQQPSKKKRGHSSAAASASAEEEDEEEDAAEQEYAWLRFRSVRLEHDEVQVEWEGGEVTVESAYDFLDQIGLSLYTYHVVMQSLPQKERLQMAERLAKGRKKRRGAKKAGDKKPRLMQHSSARSSGADAQVAARMDAMQLRVATAASKLLQAICSYCGGVQVLCMSCPEDGCAQRVCMECWMTASTGSGRHPQASFALLNFQCLAHRGALVIPIHASVQKYGLPTTQQQSIAVWTTSASSFHTYSVHLSHPLLYCTQLSPATSAADSPSPIPAAAVVLEYHSNAESGDVTFDAPRLCGPSGRDVSQCAFIEPILHPTRTQLVALLTCNHYRKQLPAMQTLSRASPNTTFLLFDITQLFVHEVQAAVCAVVRQCLLHPTVSPLHIAAEHFGKQLLQAYRPAFLFRGHLLPVVHHTKDALQPCQCGVTLKSRGFVHKRPGWEAFERFQLVRYSCKKNRCDVEMMLPHV